MTASGVATTLGDVNEDASYVEEALKVAGTSDDVEESVGKQMRLQDAWEEAA